MLGCECPPGFTPGLSGFGAGLVTGLVGLVPGRTEGFVAPFEGLLTLPDGLVAGLVTVAVGLSGLT